MKSVLWICLCVLLAGLARCHTLRDVFVENRIYFTDADCYSRMTRARMVDAAPGLIVRHHGFENFPAGIESHTTAPLDYLIVALRHGVDWALGVADPAGRSVLRGQALDLAGALVSPLLGMLTCAFLGGWARSLGRWPGIGATPLLFAVSPILVHGTALGRPDHQSLLIFLMAVALGAECRLAQKASRGWALGGGLAWALGLWVSLYEPLVLLGLVLLAWLVCAPRRLLEPQRLWQAGSLAAVGLLAFLIEGWRIHTLDPAMRGYFANWSVSIGELGHPGAAQILSWLGLGIVGAPALLILAGREDGRAWALLGLLAAVLALTCWQLRWGYFLALVFVMTLPWQLRALRRSWLAWVCVVALLWPMAGEWEATLFPEDAQARRIELQRREAVLLREVAGRMQSTTEQAFLAPWWVSPPLAYWSGQPGVAGSSHEGMAGIVDSARIYLAADARDIALLLRARRIHWIVADEPSRVIDTSRQILGASAPEQPLAALLVERPREAAPFLSPFFANDFFKVFAVDDSKLPP